jgi:HlyD family secretion protein
MKSGVTSNNGAGIRDHEDAGPDGNVAALFPSAGGADEIRAVSTSRGRVLLWGGIVSLVCASAFAMWSMLPRGPSLSASSLRVAPVTAGAFAPQVSGSAVALSVDGRLVTVREAGSVTEVTRRNGDRVVAGDLLLRLESPSVRLQVADALLSIEQQRIAFQSQRLDARRRVDDAAERKENIRFALEGLETELMAQQRLLERGIVALSRVERLEREVAFQRTALDDAAIALARAQREFAAGEVRAASAFQQLDTIAAQQRARLDAFDVRAPVAGRVADLEAEIGLSLQPGARVATITSGDITGLSLRLPESEARSVSVGARGEAHTDPRFPLVVESIDPLVREGMVTMRLAISGTMPGGMLPGQEVSVSIDLGEAWPALTLPTGALLGTGHVYVVTADGRYARRRTVTFGERARGTVEVLSGLKAGENVVIDATRDPGDVAMFRIVP